MWRAASFNVEGRYVETFGDVLMAIGAVFVDIGDAYAATQREQALFGEPGTIALCSWEISRVSAVFDLVADIPTLLASACAAVGLDAVPPYTISELSEQDCLIHDFQLQPQPISVPSLSF